MASRAARRKEEAEKGVAEGLPDGMPGPALRRRLLGRLLWAEVVPDPRGATSLLLVATVLLWHLSPTDAASGCLFSQSAPLEVLGHIWLVLGPPLALYLGVRHLLVKGDSLLPLITVPVSALLTALTCLAIAVATLSGGS